MNIHVCWGSIFPLSTIFLLYFGTVPTVWFCFFHFIIFVFTSLKFDKSACGLYDSCWLFCRPIIFNQINLLLTSFHWISKNARIVHE
jgi:hypothetical protein